MLSPHDKCRNSALTVFSAIHEWMPFDISMKLYGLPFTALWIICVYYFVLVQISLSLNKHATWKKRYKMHFTLPLWGFFACIASSLFLASHVITLFFHYYYIIMIMIWITYSNVHSKLICFYNIYHKHYPLLLTQIFVNHHHNCFTFYYHNRVPFSPQNLHTHTHKTSCICDKNCILLTQRTVIWCRRNCVDYQWGSHKNNEIWFEF